MGVLVVYAQGRKSDLIALGRGVVLGVGVGTSMSGKRELDSIAFEFTTEGDRFPSGGI